MLLQCQNISKNFGGLEPLFSGLSLSLDSTTRLGIVGPNGCGKSTLLRILAGKETCDAGIVSFSKNIRIAFVEQNHDFPKDKTVKEFLGLELDKKPRLSEGERHEASIWLAKLGFQDKLDALIGSLSGGWQKKLAIALSTMFGADILLMDEPTNHLDLGSIGWLTQFLQSLPFPWAVISHDRDFLNRTAKQMLEINPCYEGGYFLTQGGFFDFKEKKEQYLNELANYAQSLSQKVIKETKWLNTMPKARTTKAQYRIDQALALAKDLSQLKQRLQEKSTKVQFAADELKQSKKLLELTKVSFAYGDKKILSNFSWVLRNRERVGLLGDNGSGKSTLLKIIQKELKQDSGTIVEADQLKIAYFSQNRDEIAPTKTVKQALSPDGDHVVFQERSVHIMSYLLRFGFEKHHLDAVVGKLSGGEKARLLIARLMLSKADCLILDEPTNDLDLDTLDALEQNLLEFSKAVILVSHDRQLMETVCTSFLGFNPKGELSVYSSVAQWLDEQKSMAKKEKENPKVLPKAQMHGSITRRKLSYKEQLEFDGLEGKILAIEEELEACRIRTVDPSVVSDALLLNKLCEKMNAKQAELDRLYERWSELE